jgi:hypothetical protein
MAKLFKASKASEDTKSLIREEEKGQTKYWSKEKGQKDKQRSTKHCAEN